MRKNFDLSLYLVTDQILCRQPLADVVAASVHGGATMVQLREKNLGSQQFAAQARAIKKSLPAHVPLIVNDDVEVALLVQADGVHLGQDDMPPQKARYILGDKAIIGLSVGSHNELERFDPALVDYVGLGPAYPTQTKIDAGQALGVDGIRILRAKINAPCVAIGGINASNARDIMQSGVDGVAVVSAICSANDPARAAQDLRHIIMQARA